MRYFLIFLAVISLMGAGLMAAAQPAVGAVGLIGAAVYALILFAVLRRSPLVPSQADWRWVASSVLWGGVVSLGLVSLVGVPLLGLAERLGVPWMTASISGAYPEELIKALGVLLIMLAFRLDRPWHGLSTGVLVGFGFDVAENYLYGFAGAMLHPDSDAAGAVQTWVLRSLLGPGLHIALTALAGFGVGLFVTRRSRSFTTLAGWLFLAFTLHFLWNLQSFVTLALVSLVLYPLVIWLWVSQSRLARADWETPIRSLSAFRSRYSDALDSTGPSVE